MTRHPAGLRGSYGFDAPSLVVVPALLVPTGVMAGVLASSVWPLVGVGLVLAATTSGWYSMRRGKFVVWARLLDDLGLSGDEYVVDIGCGRGAVLVLAAARLRSGRAAGIDLWRRQDQSGNSPQATVGNAVAEGVADRIDVITGDMTRLPFRDDSVDVVVSNLAVHNAGSPDRMAAAIDEAVRILRPGGRIRIADLHGTGHYRDRLVALGMTDVVITYLGWRVWCSGPWLPTRLVAATKPAG